MLVTDNAWRRHFRGRGQWIYGGKESLAGPLARQYDRCRQMGERVHCRGVRKIVSGHVDCLNGRDSSGVCVPRHTHTPRCPAKQQKKKKKFFFFFFSRPVRRPAAGRAGRRPPQAARAPRDRSRSSRLNGIMDLWVREARLFKYGSGTGTNFWNCAATVKRYPAAVVRPGSCRFSASGTTAGTKSGGTTRRAAKMVCLDLDIPISRNLSIGR